MADVNVDSNKMYTEEEEGEEDLTANGWYIFVAIIFIYYIWCKYLRVFVERYIYKNDGQSNSISNRNNMDMNATNNDGNNTVTSTVVSSSTQQKENENLDAVRRARLRLLEDYEKTAKVNLEKMKLKQEKQRLLKINEKAKDFNIDSLNGQPKSNERSLRGSTFNPLMGSSSGGACYRPSRKNPERG